MCHDHRCCVELQAPSQVAVQAHRKCHLTYFVSSITYVEHMCIMLSFFLQVCRGIYSWKVETYPGYRGPTQRGLLQTLTYNKKRSDTELRVGFYTVLDQEQSDACSQWYFQFNGKNCSDPGEVITSAYTHISVAGNARIFRRSPSVVSGVCKGTSAGGFQPGSITITVRLGACPGAPGGAPHTGQSLGVDVSYIIIEEYCPPN